jgi:RimJ/RimL family protein N-acetyltransferase
MNICKENDAKELSEMARDIWIDYYTPFLNAELPEYVVEKFQSEEAIREQIKNGYLYSFVIFDEKKIGYYCIHPEGESLFMSKYYISKEYRGKGFGSKVMDEILENGREMNMKRVYLRVNKYNSGSIKIYLHKGFVTVGELEEDIGDGFVLEDYVMEYRL